MHKKQEHTKQDRTSSSGGATAPPNKSVQRFVSIDFIYIYGLTCYPH